jgi:hypothetical protein
MKAGCFQGVLGKIDLPPVVVPMSELDLTIRIAE